MEQLVICGGKKLSGTVAVHGSKNAASKCMIASLLTDEPCVIENIPLSGEIDIAAEICTAVGSVVRLGDDHVCRIETAQVLTPKVPQLSRRNRLPILAIGPLVHRTGTAEVPILGGDPIGHRPIDFHFDALSRMGVRIERQENSYVASARALHGAVIEFPYPSVGATENVLLTAVRAEGRTEILNAAVEPEIMNLIAMLVLMGARIAADVEQRHITIDGVSRLHGAMIRIVPDRNEAVSFAAAALVTNGDVLVQDIEASYFQPFLTAIEQLGAHYEIQKSGIRFWGAKPYRPLSLETAPHPGFMTDWQQPFCVLLTQASGESIIHETVYEERFGFVKDLNRMGADITVSDECHGVLSCRFAHHTFNHSALIKGPTELHGTEIAMKDIRAGMAHILASLAAGGESVISGVEHIDRGYEKLDERLRGLGADIQRISKF